MDLLVELDIAREHTGRQRDGIFGYQECVVHNQSLLAVFETIGGRCTHLFVRGPGVGDTAIGVEEAGRHSSSFSAITVTKSLRAPPGAGKVSSRTHKSSQPASRSSISRRESRQ